MDELQKFLKAMPPDDRESFATRCGTTLGYLRKAISTGQQLGEKLCVNIDRESGGVISCESLRDDVDWAYIRATGCDCKEKAAA